MSCYSTCSESIQIKLAVLFNGWTIETKTKKGTLVKRVVNRLRWDLFLSLVAKFTEKPLDVKFTDYFDDNELFYVLELWLDDALMNTIRLNKW